MLRVFRGFRAQGFRVSGSGLEGLGFRVLRVWGFRVLGCRDSRQQLRTTFKSCEIVDICR